MKLTQPFSVYIMKSAHQDYFDDGSSLSEKLASIRDKNPNAKFSNNTYNMTPHLTQISIDQSITYPYQSADMDFKLAASYASFAQMRKIGGIEVGNWVKITRHTLDYFAQQFPEIANQLMAIKDRTNKDSNHFILNNSNFATEDEINDIQNYVSSIEGKLQEKYDNKLSRNAKTGRLNIEDDKERIPEDYVIGTTGNKKSVLNDSLKDSLLSSYNLLDTITFITDNKNNSVILEQTIFFGIIDNIIHRSSVDEETGLPMVLFNIKCKSFLEPMVNSQIAPFHVMEFSEFDKSGKQKISEKFMSSIGFLGNAREEVDIDTAIGREDKFKKLYSDILSQYIIDPNTMKNIILKIRKVSEIFKDGNNNPEAIKNTLDAMLKGLSTKFLPLGLQPSSLADPIKRNKSKMINKIRSDYTKKKLTSNKSEGINEEISIDVEDTPRLINPNGLLTLGMVLNVATSQRDIPRCNSTGYEQFMPLTDIPLFPKGLLLTGGNLQPTTIWNMINNMFVTDDNIIELFPILIPLTKKIEYERTAEDKEFDVNQDVPENYKKYLDTKAGGGRGAPTKMSLEQTTPKYLLRRYENISLKSADLGVDAAGNERVKQSNIASDAELNDITEYGIEVESTGFNVFNDQVVYEIIEKTVSNDFNLSDRTNEAIIDFYNELGAVPTIIFRLKPLDPDLRITNKEINAIYQKANQRRLNALKDLKGTGFNPSIPAYFYDELKDKTYSEQLSAAVGVGINLNQDSCFSKNLPYIEIDELIDFQVTQIEDKRINAVYVESDVVTVNAGSASVSFNTSPILDDRDIIINGLRLYKTEFPFNVNSKQLVQINEGLTEKTEQVQLTENTFKLPSAIAERVYALYGRNSEKVEGTFTFKGHEFLDILCGSWLCLRANRNNLHQGLNLNSLILQFQGNSDLIDFYCYVNKVSCQFAIDDAGNMIKLTTVTFERGKWGTLNIPQFPTKTFSQRIVTTDVEKENNTETNQPKGSIDTSVPIQEFDEETAINKGIKVIPDYYDYDIFEEINQNIGIHEQLQQQNTFDKEYPYNNIAPFKNEEQVRQWYADDQKIDLGDQPAAEAYALEKENINWLGDNEDVLERLSGANNQGINAGTILVGRIPGTNKELIALGLTYNTFGPYDADSELIDLLGLTENPGYEDGVIDEYDIQNDDYIDYLNDLIITINEERERQGLDIFKILSDEEATAIRLINGILP